MKFWQAMKALEEGKMVRSCNDPEGHYVFKTIDQVILIAAEKSYDKSTSPLGSMILQDWELYEEPEKELTFAEVIKGLKKWKRFRRKSWPNIDYCIHVTAIGICESYTSKAWFAYPEDFEATDWVEVR